MDYRNDNNGGGMSKELMVALILIMASVIILMGFVLYMMLGKNDSSQEQNNQSASVGSTAAVTTQAPVATTQAATTQATTAASAQVDTQAAATESKPASTATNNYYIIEDSDSRYVDTSDLAGLSSWELKCARNEIYARHGRKFDNSSLQNYFNSQAWYSGTVSPSDFSENVLNKYEKANINFIKQYEDGNVADTSSSYNDYYILPYSDTSYVSYGDLDGLSQQDLKYARNEIYARHGRRFDNSDLQNYFDSQAWYSGTISPSDFSENVLNKYEKANISTIKEYEDSHY